MQNDRLAIGFRLWTIVNSYHAAAIMYSLSELFVLEYECWTLKARAKASGPLPEDFHIRLIKVMGAALSAFENCGLPECSHRVTATFQRFQKPFTDASTIASGLCTLREEVLDSLNKRKFVRIADDRSDYVDQENLFGDSVFDAFPSARADIREAGNCLAVECNTACVFHLMRVAEHGIRALANDRQIAIPKDVPIELATWEQMIIELEKAERAIQQYPKTLAREAQFDFYHGIMIEVRAFKNKFRNAVMHTRDEHDRDQAKSAFTHVGAFMRMLSRHISEHRVTPAVWQ